MNRCPNCNAIIVKGKETFHSYDCCHNTLSLESWKNQDFYHKEKIVNNIIQEFKYESEINKLTFKELADELIQEVWSKEKFGNRNSVLLDRIINILFKLHEENN